ncbi:MAG: hypothetical protein ACREJM_02225 [Candidatus Saccharimonadales bacterium]
MKKQINLVAIAAVLVIIFGTIYAAVQQGQRRDANYPQIQMAEDTAAQIDANKDPHAASLLGPVDMSSSLAPFTIVYDGKGNVVAGSGYLGKKVPKAPLDMLKASKGKTYHAVTWQPQTGVRIATVTVAAEVQGKKTTQDYYVMSGRSLTEVEKNENRTLWIAVAGGILSLLVVAAAVVVKSVLPGQPGRQA